MNQSQDIINYINKSLERTVNPLSKSSTPAMLKLSKIGEQSVIERWNKSEKNGGYNQLEREMV